MEIIGSCCFCTCLVLMLRVCLDGKETWFLPKEDWYTCLVEEIREEVVTTGEDWNFLSKCTNKVLNFPIPQLSSFSTAQPNPSSWSYFISLKFFLCHLCLIVLVCQPRDPCDKCIQGLFWSIHCSTKYSLSSVSNLILNKKMTQKSYLIKKIIIHVIPSW